MKYLIATCGDPPQRIPLPYGRGSAGRGSARRTSYAQIASTRLHSRKSVTFMSCTQLAVLQTAHIPLRHDLFQVAVAERESQVPADAQDDELAGEVSSPDQSWSAFPYLHTLPGPPGYVRNTA